MILAAIDIGSNAGRLLIANVISTKSNTNLISRIAFVRVPLRLGMDVYDHGSIEKQRFSYLIHTLQAFKGLLNLYAPEKVMACATAAMREAKNGEYIADIAHQISGIKIKLIDGIEEARLIRSGVNFPNELSTDYQLMVDVGGGSTEITILEGETYVNSQSFKIGTLRLLRNKVAKGEWKKMQQWIRANKPKHASTTIIGSGGNINKLTNMFGDPAVRTISYEQLQHGTQLLSTYSVEDRMDQFYLKEDRADVIVPAGEVFLKVMDITKVNQVLAPKLGLAEGIVCDLFNSLSQ